MLPRLPSSIRFYLLSLPLQACTITRWCYRHAPLHEADLCIFISYFTVKMRLLMLRQLNKNCFLLAKVKTHSYLTTNFPSADLCTELPQLANWSLSSAQLLVSNPHLAKAYISSQILKVNTCNCHQEEAKAHFCF